MKKNWENQAVNINSLFKSYDNKYGVNSNYKDSQRLFFGDKEVKSNLKKSFSFISKNSKNVFSIGINNGREIIELQKAGYLRSHEYASVVGFDISKSALQSANLHLSGASHKLILGDIASGIGRDIISKTAYSLPDKSFDLCLAFTSLSSSNLYLNTGYESILEKVIRTMQDNSCFLIVAPNCTIINGTYKSGGTFLASKNSQDPAYARNFIKDTEIILKKHNYKTSVFGDKFIFLLAKRVVLE